jgi:hypothetical protein
LIFDALSSNSRAGIEIPVEDGLGLYEILGSFTGVVPGGAFDDPALAQANALATVSTENIYFNGQLGETRSYNPSVLFLDFSRDDRTPILYAGNDVVYAPQSAVRGDNVVFYGYGGSDTYHHFGKGQYDDTFFGGAGLDTLRLEAPSSNYTISRSAVWDHETQP